jgi:hypothetical protein
MIKIYQLKGKIIERMGFFWLILFTLLLYFFYFIRHFSTDEALVTAFGFGNEATVLIEIM